MTDLSQYTNFSKAELDTTFTRPVVITNIEERMSKTGKPYVQFTFNDGETEIAANLFNTSKEQIKEKNIDKLSVVDVTFSVSNYNNKKSFKVEDIKLNEDPNISYIDFIKHPPVDIDQMYNEIISLLKSAADTCNDKYIPLSDLTISILEDNKQKFMTSSASWKMHHNLLGGLIYHTYRMIKASDALCNVYTELDRELLLCGTALHDIGKIWEYKTSPYGDAEMTSSGILFGHLYMGAVLIKQYSGKDNYNPEKIKLLVHMILSHHGKREFGAVALPAIPEALVLSHVDDLDAKMYVFDETYNTLESGGLTEKKDFMLDTKLYKPHDME